MTTTWNLDPTSLSLLVALLYILIFGGLSLLRREGLSVQFALESIGLTALLMGGSWLLGIPLGPVALLLILYVVTMRSRLLVDLANLLAQRDRYAPAFRIYDIALKSWPDTASRLIILANRGAAVLRSGDHESAIATLEDVLNGRGRVHLGRKYEAATRYNLAVAYDRAGQPAKATQLFNQVPDLLPGSLYARAAEIALKRRREQAAGAAAAPEAESPSEDAGQPLP
jgi:tetratricopeptide (TPR) repeat protein